MLYVAYGSNMNLSQMAHRCPNSSVVCNGELHGWSLVFNVHADIIETEHEEDIVPVVVWDIADEDWVSLDMYEGYPNYYDRRGVQVWFEDGTSDVAIVYVMTDNRKGICPPDRKYFDCIVKGATENDIDIMYLYDALDYAYDNETEYNQYNVKE